MKLEQVACCLCASTSAALWASENGYTMVKCSACGLVYLNPRPAAEEIDEAVRTGLHKFGEQALNVAGQYSQRKVERYVSHLREILPASDLTRTDLSWLDIGAGYGEMIGALQQVVSPKARVSGIEPCEPKVKKAAAMHLPVTSTSLSQVSGGYSHLSLINVFSHVPDPVDFLRQLGGLLETDGKLLIVTGNGADITREEFPGSLYLPDHLIFAGESTVKQALDLAGFQVIATKAYPDSPSMDSPLVTGIKNVARRIVGKPVLPLTFPKDSRFRSLWILAVRR